MSDLVDRLTSRQKIAASLRPEPNLELFKACIDRGYVHLKFTETRGGTELGVRLDSAASDLAGGDFEAGEGTVHLCGDLTLDYVRVRCHGSIDLATLEGTGYLEKVPSEEDDGDDGESTVH